MLNIMDEMVEFQELGIQRLFKWTMGACRSTSSGLSPMDSDLLPLALSHLQKARPSLVQEVMDEYCQARKNYVTRSFLDALTLGGPGGTPKPIELHAHDPQRYVGDMLAHLHQATPMEKENVYALLKHCGPISDKDKSQTCEEALAVITDGSCRPLRSRVEQILLSEHGPLILYQLTNLIRFYNGTIGHVIPKTSSLIEMLDDLDTLAYTQFLSVLQASVTHKISPRMGMEHLPGQDLNTTPNTLGLLSLLKELLNSTTVLEEKPEQNEEIVNTILDPLLNSLNSSVASFPSIDQDVYLLNSLYQIHTTLSLFKFNDIKEYSSKYTKAVANQKPLWTPGEKAGYHSISIGYYHDLLVRKVDPKHRSLSQFFKEELADPLELDFYIGLPLEENWRCAKKFDQGFLDFVQEHIRNPSLIPLTAGLLDKNSLLWKTVPAELLQSFNNPMLRQTPIPSVNGFGKADSVAKLYGMVANGGKYKGKQYFSQKTLAKLTKSLYEGLDEVLKIPVNYGRGFFLMPNKKNDSMTIGTPGAGGQMGYGDIKNKLGWAYQSNLHRRGLITEQYQPLWDAMYDSLEQIQRK